MIHHNKTRLAVIVASLSCLIAGSTKAGEIQWNKDFKKAAKQSVEQKKPMMVMVSAPWCGYCQQMLKTTFQDEKIVGHVNECFVPVYLNADKNEKWVKQLQVDGLPTTLIISPEMKVVKRLSGYRNAGQLNGQIVQLCNHTKETIPARPVSVTKKSEPVFNGICLVSLRDDGKLVKGDDRWTSTHKGEVVWFASPEHKKRFETDPQSYWPVADGICLVSKQESETPRLGRPVLAMIYADRVWFFADKARQAEFTKNPKPYLTHIRETK